MRTLSNFRDNPVDFGSAMDKNIAKPAIGSAVTLVVATLLLVIVANIEPKSFLGCGDFESRLCGKQACRQGCYDHEHGRSS